MARVFKTGITSEGTITATTFSGSGASLTSLNGSNISSGTVADACIASALTGKTYNKLTITAGATGSAFTILDLKTLTINNSLTLIGTDSTSMTFPSTNATIARTDAAQTFTGVQSMTSPAITTSITTPSTSFDLLNTTAFTVNAFGAAGDVNIGNTGTLSTGNQTVNLFTGTSSTGTTQTINIGTGNFGVSTQTINIGTGTITSATRTINIGSSSGTGTANLRGTVNFAGTTSTIQLNSQAGTTGQVLTSAGAGNTPTWADEESYTLIASSAFSSAPSFSSIPQTYKKLVAVIVFTNMGTFATTLTYNFNATNTGYSRMAPGVTGAWTASAGAAAQLSTVVPTVGNSYVVTVENYTSPRAIAQSHGDVVTFSGTIAAAVTSMAFAAGAPTSTWGGATGTAYLYGVK